MFRMPTRPSDSEYLPVDADEGDNPNEPVSQVVVDLLELQRRAREHGLDGFLNLHKNPDAGLDLGQPLP